MEKAAKTRRHISTGADIQDFYFYFVLVFVFIVPFLRTYGETWWSHMCEKYGENEFAMYSFLCFQFIVFWSHCAIMALVDLYKPAFLQEYKVQPDVNVPKSMMWKACKIALFNLVSVSGPMLLIWFRYILPHRGNIMSLPFPSWFEILRDLTVCVLIEEVMFYYSHRLLHAKAFYAKYHKLHHQFTAPVGVVAIYCTPVEMIASNMLPLMTGPTLMGSHIITINIWFMLALINTINSHCGYNFPGMPAPYQHDFHHEKFNDNFGILGILDSIHGTNKRFLEHIKTLRAQQDDKIF